MSNANKLMLFLILFSVSIIVTYPSFAVSHGLDSYCTACNGYYGTALWFLQNGRIFSALAFVVFDFLNVPFDSLSFISSFLTDLFLSFTILKLYLYLDENAKFKNSLTKVIVLISLFLLFYNPFLIEFFEFDEGCIMMLGILLVTFGVYRISLGKLKNYVFGILFVVLGVSCYQAIACYLFILLLLLMISKKEINLKELFFKLGVGLFAYGVSFLITLIIIKLNGLITGNITVKVGNMDIFSNLGYIFTSLLPNTFRYLFGFIDYKLYYGIVLVLIIIMIYIIFKNDNKVLNIILLTCGICFCALIPFIPNIFMSSSNNYTAARMCMTILCLPSFLVLMLLFRFKLNITSQYFIGCTISIFLLLSVYLIHQNLMIDFKRYKEDVKYIKEINARIEQYQLNSNINIKKVYYAYDTDSAYYYSFGHNNGVNIRVMAVDWGFDCAFKVYSNGDYNLLKMKDEDYEKYFKDKDYHKINDDQFKFVDDTLYLLIY